MDYQEHLAQKFKSLKFELVDFDNGATPESMQCYLLVSGLTKEMLKDKGITALDLGNYVYRKFGFWYEFPPEYSRRGEPKNSLAFYQSKEKFRAETNKHIREWIVKHGDGSLRPESVLYHRRRLSIPTTQEETKAG